MVSGMPRWHSLGASGPFLHCQNIPNKTALDSGFRAQGALDALWIHKAQKSRCNSQNLGEKVGVVHGASHPDGTRRISSLCK